METYSSPTKAPGKRTAYRVLTSCSLIIIILTSLHCLVYCLIYNNRNRDTKTGYKVVRIPMNADGHVANKTEEPIDFFYMTPIDYRIRPVGKPHTPPIPSYLPYIPPPLPPIHPLINIIVHDLSRFELLFILL